MKIIISFIGDKAWKLFWLSTISGSAWFLIESSFVFILQGFLSSLGLLDVSKTFLPNWFPTSPESTVLCLVVFGFFRALTGSFKHYLALMTQASFICLQRSRILEFSLKNAASVSSKEVVSVFTDLTTQAGSVLFYISLLINTSIVALLLLVFGLSLAPIEMTISIILLSISIYPVKYFAKKINLIGKELNLEWLNVSQSVLIGLKNNFFLKIYNKIDTEIDKGKESLAKYENNYSKYSIISGLNGSLPLFVGSIVISITTYLSVHFIHTDGVKLVSFFYIFIRLAQAAGEASSTFSFIKLNTYSFKMLLELHRKRELKLIENTIDSSSLFKIDTIKQIEFKNVNYSYDNSPLLKNLSFKIKRGESLIIKGVSGSGKSTILALLMGIIKPKSGEIIINDFTNMNFDFYSLLGYVGPEPYMIEGSIKDNLLYGINSNQPTIEDIWNTLKVLELDLLIEKLPGKLDQKLSEVSELSTGQKQRLSIARSILRRPEVLILDEATANLDSKTENGIINQIRLILPRNCIMIIVTHKDSFDKIGDHFIKL